MTVIDLPGLVQPVTRERPQLVTTGPDAGTVDVPPGPVNVPSPTTSLEEEQRQVQLVRQLFYRARDARRPMLQNWKRWYRVLNNKLWSRHQRQTWEPSSEIPQIWPTVASMVAWMTDQRPVLSTMAGGKPFSPFNQFYDQLSQDMDAILETGFSEYHEDAEIAAMLWDVATYGIGWLKEQWLPWLADGLGDSTFRRCDPYMIYPDPFARGPADMNHIIEAKIMTLTDLDRAWPGAAQLLDFQAFLEDVDEQPHKLDTHVRYGMPRTQLAPLQGSSTSYVWSRRGFGPNDHANREEPVLTVLECWVRTHEVRKTDDDGVAKVDDVWMLYVMAANRIIYSGRAEDVNAYGTHPFERMVLFESGEMYGSSLVEFMESPQESINRIVGAIERNTLLMGNPMLAEGNATGSRRQKITNRPGTRLRGTKDQVGYIQPPAMHPQQSVALLGYFEGKIETISGMSAIVRGFTPSGRNSEGVLDSVQDAAFVRIRASLRELERTLKGISKKKVATVAEFYTEPRMQSIIGRDGTRTRLATAQRHFYTYDGERIPLRFSLLADAGSQLPTSRQARASEAERMFALGAIDHLEVLRAKQWPNADEVANRVMGMQATGQSNPPSQRNAARA